MPVYAFTKTEQQKEYGTMYYLLHEMTKIWYSEDNSDELERLMEPLMVEAKAVSAKIAARRMKEIQS